MVAILTLSSLEFQFFQVFVELCELEHPMHLSPAAQGPYVVNYIKPYSCTQVEVLAYTYIYEYIQATICDHSRLSQVLIPTLCETHIQLKTIIVNKG